MVFRSTIVGVLLAGLAVTSAFQAPRRSARAQLRAATPQATMVDTLLLLADTKATVTEAVGPEIYGPIFFGGRFAALEVEVESLE